MRRLPLEQGYGKSARPVTVRLFIYLAFSFLDQATVHFHNHTLHFHVQSIHKRLEPTLRKCLCWLTFFLIRKIGWR